ncbi:stage III sporulation protein SpoIIIAB [Effusibacillus lacus]|uniref:Stage III sporulation protein AB n=1 Tax=Effusibacillus lacus TaxID=1348429 RepID=A0A292YE16_9BACL|nr:stage III sporulation protein SpoIIIAB [Effusibacillus lacus]TCS72535.1 stage III sporulation protein AB [Effusibacillus lacus]GAX90902.1 stage III sporulation protein AB [Effusibacillus lacus]
MIKLVGSVMIIMAAAGLGFWRATTYSERARQLNQLITALQMLETEISYGATPLPEALSRIGRRIPGPIGLLLDETGQRLMRGEGGSVGLLLQSQFEQWSPRLSLQPQDREILLTFGQTLGVSDRSDQLKHIRLACTRLAAEESLARDERDRLGKMWRYLGVLTGAAAVIIMY